MVDVLEKICRRAKDEAEKEYPPGTTDRDMMIELYIAGVVAAFRLHCGGRPDIGGLR